MATTWMRAPNGERKEVEADPVELARLMNNGWSQCAGPEEAMEVTHDADLDTYPAN